MNTFQSYKGRTISAGQKVKVYRNLHRKTYSIADAKTGLVLGYSDTVAVEAAQFKVSEAGRQRVLQERKKNVHAFVTGKYVGTTAGNEEKAAYYNPYKVDSFIDSDSQTPLSKVASVSLTLKGVFYN